MHGVVSCVIGVQSYRSIDCIAASRHRLHILKYCWSGDKPNTYIHNTLHFLCTMIYQIIIYWYQRIHVRIKFIFITTVFYKAKAVCQWIVVLLFNFHRLINVFPCNKLYIVMRTTMILPLHKCWRCFRYKNVYRNTNLKIWADLVSENGSSDVTMSF